jgi:hypothetical protein
MIRPITREIPPHEIEQWLHEITRTQTDPLRWIGTAMFFGVVVVLCLCWMVVRIG